MSPTPSVVVFDVNETLSDMSAMGERFAEVGVSADLAKLWFATLLREGFALATTRDSARFGDIGAQVLAGLLAGEGVDAPGQTAQRLASSVADLPLHPDVPAGVRALRAAGHRLVTLTNGAAATAEKLATTGGIRDEFEQFLSVDDAEAWKPHSKAYAYAARRCGTDAEEMLLVAVHPWDIHGAARAGLRTAWINRTGATYPSYFAQPDITVTALTELPAALVRLS